MYKKIWTFALIAAMIFTLTACTDGEKPQGGAEQGQSEIAPDGNAQHNHARDNDGATDIDDEDREGNVAYDTPVSNTPEGDTPVSSDGNSDSDPSGGGTTGSAGNGNTVDGYEDSAGNGNSSSSAGNGSIGSKDPAQSTPPSASKELTYEEYHALSGEKQQEYYESFASVEDFFKWYNVAKAEYEKENAAIDIGDGEIDLDEVIGGGK